MCDRIAFNRIFIIMSSNFYHKTFMKKRGSNLKPGSHRQGIDPFLGRQGYGCELIGYVTQFFVSV